MKKSLILPTLAAMLTLTACGSGDKGMTAHDSALSLQTRIDSLIAAGNFTDALADIDTFPKLFPLETEIRRQLLETRAQATEGVATQRLPQLQGEIAQLQMQADSLQALFTSVQPVSSLPPYLVWTAGQKGLSAPGIQPRVNTGDDAVDTPWTIAVDAGRNIALHTMAVSTSAGDFAVQLPAGDGAMASAQPEVCAPMAKALAEGATLNSITLVGSKGKVSLKATPALAASIAGAYSLANTRTQLREKLIEAEKTERLLQLARDQKANAAPQL